MTKLYGNLFSRRAILLGLTSLFMLGGSSSLYAKVSVGQQYFTQYNIWVEKEKHVTTNYSRGELIPLNTAVTVESIGGKTMVLDVDGRKIMIENVRKFTLRDIKQIAEEMLAPNKVSLASFAKDRQLDIQSGILRLGMSKEQAIMTRGYPPRHKTPTTNANQWVYWTSRFVQLTIVFENGKLTRGRGLY
ncbi:hypothetical protein [Arenicella xantha]|uniref:SmpA/OmlA family protein n=1 Tax=Arenicella xantha TaxID=644221 RepID=A0A395JPV8_9GAMM|nr:hypothetical protein [Arenicella xantha]RBP53373.1 hypothetical protein DFR28_101759 [Arenicella xantha]